MSGKDERKDVIGKDMNCFVEKRKRQKSRIYSIPYKRQRRNQPSEQIKLGIVQQVLPIKNNLIARTYSKKKRETKIQSIKAGVSSLANAHEKRAQKDGSYTTGAANILRPFFHAHHQQSDDEKKKTTTKNQTSSENSYLCEQSIKKITEPKIMSSKKLAKKSHQSTPNVELAKDLERESD